MRSWISDRGRLYESVSTMVAPSTSRTMPGTVWAALQIGTPEPLPDEAVQRLHQRYTTEYGQ